MSVTRDINLCHFIRRLSRTIGLLIHKSLPQDIVHIYKYPQSWVRGCGGGREEFKRGEGGMRGRICQAEKENFTYMVILGRESFHQTSKYKFSYTCHYHLKRIFSFFQ